MFTRVPNLSGQSSMVNHIDNSAQNNIIQNSASDSSEKKSLWQQYQDYKQSFYDMIKGTYNESAQGYQDSKMSEAERIQMQNYLYSLALAEQQQSASQTSADKAMAFEDAQALRARQWQLEDRESAYQVAVADMKKAGLNPAVMFSNGANSASQTSPISASGQSASMTAGQADNSTLAQVLQESMSNQTAITNTLINNLSQIFQKFIPKSAISIKSD